MTITAEITALNAEWTNARRQMLAASFFIDAINELEVYLQSAKFHTDPTVQVQDVLNRIAEARTRANEIADDLEVRVRL